MKIWEIAENREFRGNHIWRNTRFKIMNGELAEWLGREWAFSKLNYNEAVSIDFEYLPEKKYYLKLKPEMKACEWGSYLNFDRTDNNFSVGTTSDTTVYKTRFTEKEIKELIPPLWLTICEDPIEVEDE